MNLYLNDSVGGDDAEEALEAAGGFVAFVIAATAAGGSFFGAGVLGFAGALGGGFEETSLDSAGGFRA